MKTKQNKKDLTYTIKMKGLELGFSKVGITNADDFTDYLDEIADSPDYHPWIYEEPGFYVGQGAKPKSFFPEAKSIICAVYGYGNVKYPEKLSKYIGHAYLARCFNPLKTSSSGIRIETFKDFLIENGCDLYIGDIAIPARRACARAGCPPGCNACINSCPTKALSVGKLIPTKCMLFNNINTIEISSEQREHMGTRIHGCDIYQKACPRNKKILENASKRDYFLEELDKKFDI